MYGEELKKESEKEHLDERQRGQIAIHTSFKQLRKHTLLYIVLHSERGAYAKSIASSVTIVVRIIAVNAEMSLEKRCSSAVAGMLIVR